MSAHEQAMLCPYGCGPHKIKEGLDRSWSCPRCCRSAPLWVVAHAAYERGRTAGDAAYNAMHGSDEQKIHELREEVARLGKELAELRSQANEYGPAPRSPMVNSAELARDVATVRFFIDITIAGGTNPSGAPQALGRIAAALGLGSG